MKQISKKLISWASIIDQNALDQARMTSGMSFITPHLALMPDAHLGKGSTIGSVVPTMGAIMPAAVGVDIGCGMIAVKTQFTQGDLEGFDLSILRQSIERSIPLSAGKYNRTLTETAEDRIQKLFDFSRDSKAVIFYNSLCRTNWQYHLGTLGSGNHFIEISLDEDDNVWLFLHSGSRGIGNKIAMHHIAIAQKLMEKYFIQLPDKDLAYLVEDTQEFYDYISDLNWAQKFARLNREEMMDRVIKDFSHWIGNSIEEEERINCHHNFTQKENHYGKNVWLTRKGAIEASVGKLGLIPGSMGTRSYVVEGKGFAPSFNSAPHGAGRVYSRGEARRTFTSKQLEEAMVGIEYRKTDAFLDEIPQAYKDIDVVIKDAEQLVEIKHTLRQIVNVKGD